MSSSLSAPAEVDTWNKIPQPARVVPVIAMVSVLDAIPDSLLLWYLKTDMQVQDEASWTPCLSLIQALAGPFTRTPNTHIHHQGQDFKAVASAGRALRRVRAPRPHLDAFRPRISAAS